MEEAKIIPRDPNGSEGSSSREDSTSQESEQPNHRIAKIPYQGTDQLANQLCGRLPKPYLRVDEILISADASKNMCRICLSRDRTLYKIKYPAMAKVLRVVTGQELDTMEAYHPPGFACSDCNDLMDAFSTFRCDARIANLNLMSGIRYVAGIAPDPETW
ncbi:unnamed protein product [Spodoptera exigua]|nr:unnamed protein product [Spodoptera exigua]